MTNNLLVRLYWKYFLAYKEWDFDKMRKLMREIRQIERVKVVGYP